MEEDTRNELLKIHEINNPIFWDLEIQDIVTRGRRNRNGLLTTNFSTLSPTLRRVE